MCFSLAPTFASQCGLQPQLQHWDPSGIGTFGYYHSQDTQARRRRRGDRGDRIIARLQQISLHARPLIQDLAKPDVDWCSGHSFCRCIAHCGMLISRRLAVALQWCFEPSLVHGRPCGAYARIRSCFAKQRNQELGRWRAEASVTRCRQCV